VSPRCGRCPEALPTLDGHGPVAQLGERLAGSEEVRGSSPLRSTITPAPTASPTERGHLIRWLARTDVGLLRESNQDAAYAARTPSGDIVLAVVDGMGGMPFGERAATLVIGACEVLPIVATAPPDWLRDRIESARGALDADERADPSRTGMGATVVLALVRGGVAWIAHAGDSRAYTWSPRGLERLTEDHNAAAESVRQGAITAEEAMHDPGRHRLTRAVLTREARPEFAEPIPMRQGDVLLLVSDGITGTLEDREIARAVESGCGNDIIDALVAAARERGAPDNIGIALADTRC
jgi:PPM family protein phosphatase